MNEILKKNEGTADWIDMRKRAIELRKKANTILYAQYENLQNSNINKKEWDETIKTYKDDIDKANDCISKMNILVPSLSLQRGYFDAEREINKLSEKKKNS